MSTSKPVARKTPSPERVAYFRAMAERHYADACAFAEDIGLGGDREAISAAGAFVGAGVAMVKEED
ncbi:hypothetical protein [Paramagnetospirillum kuznetsovii]|uniref:hypothetical protein n=1 Tax=Paramagnetospirillum kuznetsovii TaxID=2053833 RepID=UPI0013752CC7|nr:hypothetical protein [Paramagnetospirillum kuznetsovii]